MHASHWGWYGKANHRKDTSEVRWPFIRCRLAFSVAMHCKLARIIKDNVGLLLIQTQLSTAYAPAARLPRHSGQVAGLAYCCHAARQSVWKACLQPVRWLLSALIWSQQMGQGASSAMLLGRVQMMRYSQATRLSSSVNLW